jgi:hypothetical protein
MSSVVSRVLKASDNFAAELLLKELGRTVRADGSSAGGIAASRQVLGALGVPVVPGADGSRPVDRGHPAGGGHTDACKDARRRRSAVRAAD